MLSTGRGVQLFWQADSPIRQKCLKLSDSSGFQCDSENPVFPDSLRFKFLKTVIRRSLSKGSCQQSTPYNRAVLWHSIPYDMLPSCLHPSSSYTGLAGMELIFFMAPPVVLCLRLVRALVTCYFTI